MTNRILSDKTELVLSGRALIMGIINLTPDSFSDGGNYNTVPAALARANALLADGADILDLGAESTRPGATPLTAAEEIARLLPVLQALRRETTAPISVDTYHAATAAAALEAGADIINDIWGLQYPAEPGEMAKVIARTAATVVCMHNQTGTIYSKDIIAAIRDFFRRSISLAEAAGISKDRLILDCGIGFGKTTPQNLTVLRRLAELKTIDDYTYPHLLGVSRKRFIGDTLTVPVEERLAGTGAACLWGIEHGANILRVHDVKAIAQAVKLWTAIATPPRDSRTIYLSLGANLGDRAATLKKALAAIAAIPETKITATSAIYETAPWGKTNQPPFLNVACRLETNLDPQDLLRETQRIETALGRVRHEHWGARTIDIDLLFCRDYQCNTPELQLPHPYLTQRAFVLIPLAEIAGDELLAGQSIKIWRDCCPDQSLVTPYN